MRETFEKAGRKTRVFEPYVREAENNQNGEPTWGGKKAGENMDPPEKPDTSPHGGLKAAGLRPRGLMYSCLNSPNFPFD